MQRDYVPLFRSICTSEKFAGLNSDTERLFYVLLLTQCDSWGRCEDSAVTLNALCWPLLAKKRDAAEAALVSLEQSGLLRRLVADGLRWIQVTGWEDRAGSIGHPDRRGASRWPQEGQSGVVRTAPDSDGLLHSEQSRAEERRTEQSRGEKKRSPSAAPAALDLESLVAGSALDTEPAKAAVREWLAYKLERRQGYTARGLAALLSKWASVGPAALEAAVRHSMANNWAGLFPPDAARPVGVNGKVEPKGFQGIRDYQAMKEANRVRST